MNALKDYVEWKLTHSDKVAEAEGYPLVLENCKKNKRMKELKVWGHNLIRDNRGASLGGLNMKLKGSSVSLDGVNTSLRGWAYDAQFVSHLKAETTYTFSVHYLSGELITCPNGVSLGVRNSSNVWFGYINLTESNYQQSTISRTFTTTTDMDVSLSCSAHGEFNNLILGVQLVEGDTVEEYKEYVGEKTVNLYDAKTYPSTDGQCIWGNHGGAGQSSSMSATEYISCSELRGKTITCGYGALNNPGIAFYDDDKVFISGKGYNKKSTITITVPENASYLRWCFNTDQKDQAMIVEGDTLPAYEPYGKYKIPIVQRGKNFIAFDDYSVSNATNVEKNEHSATWKGNISTATSQYAASTGWVRFGFSSKKTIKLFEGVPITISVDVTPLERHDETRDTATKFSIYTNESNASTFMSPAFSMDLGVKSHLVYTFIPLSRFGETINVILYLCSHTMKIENFQVEYGDVATPYEPYVEPITHTIFVDEPLSGNDILDVKEHIQLPILTSKTTIFETDTEVKPSKIYGKYIK